VEPYLDASIRLWRAAIILSYTWSACVWVSVTVGTKAILTDVRAMERPQKISAPLFSVTWDRTQAAAMGSRQLTQLTRLRIVFSPWSPGITSSETRGSRSNAGAGVSPVFIGFLLLLYIPPLLHTHISPLSLRCVIALNRQHIITS
jgi:hypothetical protein